MKKLMILLTVLVIAATPAMAATHPGKHHKQATKHVATKHQKKQMKKRLAKRNTFRKHKVAV